MSSIYDTWKNIQKLITSAASLHLKLQNDKSDTDITDIFYKQMDRLNEQLQLFFNADDWQDIDKSLKLVAYSYDSLVKLSIIYPIKNTKQILISPLKTLQQKCLFNISQKEGDVHAWEDIEESIKQQIVNFGISEGTVDILKINNLSNNWSIEQIQDFDKEIEEILATIKIMKQRIKRADKEGKQLNIEDMTWLGKWQIASPLGLKNYDHKPPVVKMVIDEYESLFNYVHYRDIVTLVSESLQLKGTGHMNRIMYDIEINRISEYKDLLELYKLSGQ